MNKNILSIGVTTIVLFVWGFLFWGVNPLPYQSWKQTGDDVRTQEMLRQYFPESGTYFVPGNDHDPEELAKLYEQGPTGFVHLTLEGRPQVDLKIMIAGFLLNLAMIILLLLLFRQANCQQMAHYSRVSILTGVTAVIFVNGGNMIWWMAPVSWEIWPAIYNLSSFLIAGHLMGLFLKKS